MNRWSFVVLNSSISYQTLLLKEFIEDLKFAFESCKHLMLKKCNYIIIIFVLRIPTDPQYLRF